MHLPNTPLERKTGKEPFSAQSEALDFKLIDFWSWNQSGLIENRTRGILAEFIIKQALNISSEGRVEWDNYDLVTQSDKKLEVKSAAYIQSWEQTKYSTISFAIAPSIGAKDHPEYDGLSRRWADFYVFCLLKHKDQKTINPLNLEQWTFYVLETAVLDKERPNQKSIGLNSLLKLNPKECSYAELRGVIQP